MKFSNLLYQLKETIAIITINRPDKLNALNALTLKEINEAIKLANEDYNVRVIILTGSGKKAFVAGADIKEFSKFNQVEGRQLSTRGHQLVFDYIENSSTPVICAINGYSLGGGLELAIASHIRIASDNAQFGLPEVSLGLIPGYGGTQRLPQLIGKGRALELMLSAGMINAQKALSYGLINHMVTPEELLDTAIKIAQSIAKNSITAIGAAIYSVNAGFDVNKDGYEVEKESFGNCFGTSDFKEGTQAFLQKRKPNFE